MIKQKKPEMQKRKARKRSTNRASYGNLTQRIRNFESFGLVDMRTHAHINDLLICP